MPRGARASCIGGARQARARSKFGSEALHRKIRTRELVDLSADAAQFARPAPALGQHTQEILAELGYEAAAVAELRARGVV